MSVKEARVEVWTRICEGDWINVANVDAALDRLIMEVQAEMPCYSEYDCCNASQECPDRLEAGGSHGCPTCQARAEKVEA